MRSPLTILVALAAVAAPSVAAQDVAPPIVDGVVQKVQAILARGVAPEPEAASLVTRFTEDELNVYLQSAHDDLPTGLRQPSVMLFDSGRLEIRALVDLDVVRLSEKRGWLDPLAYIRGVLEVQSIGVLRGAKGEGVYTLESARVGGAPVPKAVVQELLAFYTRSPETPKGIILDTPFKLPVGIREVTLSLGLATVIQ